MVRNIVIERILGKLLKSNVKKIHSIFKTIEGREQTLIQSNIIFSQVNKCI